jgi:hypothetical protein
MRHEAVGSLTVRENTLAQSYGGKQAGSRLLFDFFLAFTAAGRKLAATCAVAGGTAIK